MKQGTITIEHNSGNDTYMATITRARCGHSYRSDSLHNTREAALAHGEALLACACGVCQSHRRHRSST